MSVLCLQPVAKKCKLKLGKFVQPHKPLGLSYRNIVVWVKKYYLIRWMIMIIDSKKPTLTVSSYYTASLILNAFNKSFVISVMKSVT